MLAPHASGRRPARRRLSERHTSWAGNRVAARVYRSTSHLTKAIVGIAIMTKSTTGVTISIAQTTMTSAESSMAATLPEMIGYTSTFVAWRESPAVATQYQCAPWRKPAVFKQDLHAVSGRCGNVIKDFRRSGVC
jgi:hypothetical protein